MEKDLTIEKLIEKYDSHLRDIGDNNVYIPEGTDCVDSYKHGRLQILSSIIWDLRDHQRALYVVEHLNQNQKQGS